MQLGLDGKVVAVTGAARGIGRAVATTLHREGATVIVSDLDPDGAKAAAAELGAAEAAGCGAAEAAGCGAAEAAGCDVRSEDEVADLVAQVVTRQGRLDGFVANAGVGDVGPLAEMPFEQWRSVMAVNLDGVFLSVKHATRQMARAGGGSVVTMASATAQNGWPLIGHYAAAKAAVVSLTKTAAAELRPAGVRVNAVCPGFIDTALVKAAKSDFEAALGGDFDGLIRARQGRYQDTAEVADLVAFLISDRAGSITGSASVIDNGLTAAHL